MSHVITKTPNTITMTNFREKYWEAKKARENYILKSGEKVDTRTLRLFDDIIRYNDEMRRREAELCRVGPSDITATKDYVKAQIIANMGLRKAMARFYQARPRLSTMQLFREVLP